MLFDSLAAAAFAKLSLLAQDPAAPEPSTIGKILENPLTPIVGLFFLFYFIFIVPERRKKAEEARMMSTLKKNDRVVTIGGIHGTVVSTAGDTKVVTIRIDDNTRIKLNRTAIAQVISDKDSPGKESQPDKDKEAAAGTQDN